MITGKNPNRFRVRFYTEKPGYLVVNRLYTNLLRAYLDDNEIPIIPANGPFMAIPVSGKPRVQVMEFTYFSPPVRLSFILAVAGILIAGGGAVIGLHGKRRAGS